MGERQEIANELPPTPEQIRNFALWFKEHAFRDKHGDLLLIGITYNGFLWGIREYDREKIKGEISIIGGELTIMAGTIEHPELTIRCYPFDSASGFPLPYKPTAIQKEQPMLSAGEFDEVASLFMATDISLLHSIASMWSEYLGQ